MQSVAIPQHPVPTTAASFERLGLSAPILAIVKRIGFKHPTPIQAAVIPVALASWDLIGLAQTGSGKTAAFALPIAETLWHGRGIRGLILSPTREIALQTKAFLDLFGETHRLQTCCLIGGVSLQPQIVELRAKPDIIVATPGRLFDHLERGNVKLDEIEELVLDEADHMLDLGFLPQVQRIVRHVPSARHTMMFSATMPPPIERLTKSLLIDPIRIDLQPEGKAAAGIQHRLYLVEPEDKKACIFALLNQELGSTLVFIRRKSDAEWLSRVLEREGHPVERIHGDLTQKERTSALRGFREGEHRILVATDVAARGIDVPGIQHIINFDLPEAVEDYIHRAGRTARGAAVGVVSSIASWLEKPMILELEATLGLKLQRARSAGVRRAPGQVQGRPPPAPELTAAEPVLDSGAKAHSKLFDEGIPMNAVVLALILASLGSNQVSAQRDPVTPDLATFADGRSWKVVHADAESVETDGKRAVHLTAQGDSANGIVGLALPQGVKFSSGMIEIDLKGKNVRGRSFLGVAFNVVDEKTFEAVYFRPFNFKAEEPMRGRAVQYIAWPVNTWEHLRESAPGQFEKPVSPVPDPDGWFHAQIEVTDSQVRVFVDHAKEPSLVISRLASGGVERPVGLFVDSADGHYADFSVALRKPSNP